MVGYAKNAPKDEEWLREEIATMVNRVPKDGYNYGGDVAIQILAKMEEGGWVSPADLKEALSRELAAGFRLGLNKSKGVNDD